jgi:hypothetical protein
LLSVIESASCCGVRRFNSHANPQTPASGIPHAAGIGVKDALRKAAEARVKETWNCLPDIPTELICHGFQYAIDVIQARDFAITVQDSDRHLNA